MPLAAPVTTATFPSSWRMPLVVLTSVKGEVTRSGPRKSRRAPSPKKPELYRDFRFRSLACLLSETPCAQCLRDFQYELDLHRFIGKHNPPIVGPIEHAGIE